MPIDPSSQQEFSDADFAIVDNGDQSKKLKFEVSGIAANTTRTWTVPDSDGTIALVDADLVDLSARWTPASSAGSASLDFREDTDNGTSRVRVISAAALAADRTFTLPDVDITFSSFIATLLDDTTAAAAATTLGLGTGNSPEFTAVNIGHASDATLSRLGAASLGIEGVAIIKATGSASLALSTQLTVRTFSNTGASVGMIVDGVTLSVSGTGTGTNFMAAWYNANGLVGNINTNGSTTNYVTSSDRDLKNDDGPIDPAKAAAVLRLVRIHNFRWKKSDEAAIGVFAQELYEIYPPAVTVGGWIERERWDELKDDRTGEPLKAWHGRVTKTVKGKQEVVTEGVLLPVMGAVQHREYIPWGVDYSKLMPIVIAAMQDMDQRITALEAP